MAFLRQKIAEDILIIFLPSLKIPINCYLIIISVIPPAAAILVSQIVFDWYSCPMEKE